MLSIQNQALFVADSHYPHHGEAFLTLLRRLDSDEVKTPQLFLMGDNFDLLFGYNRYIQRFSQEAISLLQTLSQRIEIHYLEGNHDFCLSELFPDIHVYSRAMQPIVFGLGNKKVALCHGDKYVTGLGYNIYSWLLRKPFTLKLLRPFEKSIINYRMQKLSQKNICHDFKGFEARVQKILLHYQEVDLVIEGHFHQSKILGKYISLPSQACQGDIAQVCDEKILFKAL